MEGLQAELEQCKQQNRDLENTLAQANEEQEALAAQLYETGHALDEANNEVTASLTINNQRTKCANIKFYVHAGTT
jgi:septal ring factor EnvC (AmiA/AmiB activator)